MAKRPIKEMLLPWLAPKPNENAYDFSGVPKDAVAEFHRQAELCLEGTIKLAIAADSRATTSTSILSAAAAGSLVVCANLAGSDHPKGVLIASIVVAAITLITAAAFCALASRPIDFFVSGFEPELLYDAAADETHIKRVSAEDIQRRIDANRWSLRLAADTLRRGHFIAIMAPLLFTITFCLFYPG